MSRKHLAAVGARTSTGLGEPPQGWKRMEEVMGRGAAPSQPSGAALATVLAQLSPASGAGGVAVVSKVVSERTVAMFGVANTSHQVLRVAEAGGSGLFLCDSYFQALSSHKVQKYGWFVVFSFLLLLVFFS